jgi:predicted amidohydrolase
MILDLHTFDPGLSTDGPRAFADAVMAKVEASWQTGADLVVLPEFTWMGLEPLIGPCVDRPLEKIARCFWEQLYPEIHERMSRSGKAVVLGTVPALAPDGSVRNRAPIFADAASFHQDKLHLTPWEQAFSPGDKIQLWRLGGFCIAVIICLDIEIPELSARLRDCGVDLILCPSATETILGTERVNRCASARAVELGCYVGVSHLTGVAKSDLIDVNVGRAAFYRPSQAAFREVSRVEETAVFDAGSHCLRVSLDRHALEVMRRMKAETNPASLGKVLAGIQREIQVESPLNP